MDRQVLEAIREMMTVHRVLSLAVLVDGDPEASLLPFAVRPDFGALYVQASGLARHSRGLQPGARVGVLIHEHDTPEADPLQVRRMTVQATVADLPFGSSSPPPPPASWFSTGRPPASSWGTSAAGSYGFMLGALALVAHRQGGLDLWVPLILLAVFVTDASVTLLRRILRRERWYEPHRLHAYQWLSRGFGAHRPFTYIALGVNLFWLTPLAIAAARRPEMAGLLACVAYGSSVVGALLAGAGRPEIAG